MTSPGFTKILNVPFSLETCQGNCCWYSGYAGPCRAIESLGRADGIKDWPEHFAGVEGCANRCEELTDCKAFHYYDNYDHDDQCYLHKGGVIEYCEDDRNRFVGVCG